jgi:uroporphyrinogen decarboxylase
METSRERVLKAINHNQPDVTPVHVLGISDVATPDWLKEFEVRDKHDLIDKLGLDVHSYWTPYKGANTAKGLNIWGAEKDTGGAGGEGYSGVRGGYPLGGVTTVGQVDSFLWPDPTDFDYEGLARILSRAPADKAIMVMGGYDVDQERLGADARTRGIGSKWLPILCSLFNLFGYEETLVNLHAQPKVIEASVVHLEALVLEFCHRLFDATQGKAQLFWFGDDFAGQTGMIISPAHWRRFFKPTYEKIFSLAKQYDLKVWFHGCGSFRPVLRDLIDIGIDVWETVQVHLPGNEPETLKREYGKDIAFFGAVNTQSTLPFGTPEEVRAEVRNRIRVLGRDGGYICGGDHSIMPDVPFENILAMVDEAKKFEWK